MISTPFCFFLCFFAMRFFFFSPRVCWIITRMCKNRNQPRTVAQLILTVPHTQEFISPLHCINIVYIYEKSLNYGHESGDFHQAITVLSIFIKIYKLQVFHLNCSTRDGNKQAKFTLLCHINTSIVHKISLKSYLRRISPCNPFSLVLFPPNVMVNYSVIRFT